ncbi:TrmB family transcriptional regulator [Haladaptatus salinisoli]|uniref:TrmB family transcriptional regulator n=1 Tax=Haladaptatus salinisoli TaxID=2884876 RepID=UPI001D0A51F1|nr:helix-turn-helix domain-containing protein [Haladaptatus salinisoli]
MTSESEAVSALENLGLTEYEAKCFAALTRVTKATAKDVSQLSEVPRSRVYDTVERLHQRGLVDVQESDPREYRAVPKDEAFDVLRRNYRTNIEAADTALDAVESAEIREDEGVWAVADAEHVTNRVMALLDDAEVSVAFIVADETVLRDRVLDRLAAATDRGVAVTVEVPSESVKERIEEAVPNAHVAVTEKLERTTRVEKKWPGQLALVDHHSVLASGVEESDLPEVTEETGVWTRGHDHGFATWIRELLAERVGGTGATE